MVSMIYQMETHESAIRNHTEHQVTEFPSTVTTKLENVPASRPKFDLFTHHIPSRIRILQLCLILDLLVDPQAKNFSLGPFVADEMRSIDINVAERRGGRAERDDTPIECRVMAASLPSVVAGPTGTKLTFEALRRLRGERRSRVQMDDLLRLSRGCLRSRRTRPTRRGSWPRVMQMRPLNVSVVQ